MTHTLVIDTSYGSTVGLVGHEPIIETDSRTHVERLQVNISRACEQANIQPQDISRIIVGTGPGPFTGLRVGIVTAKALAFATGAQLIGQNILDAQALLGLLRKEDGSLASITGEQAQDDDPDPDGPHRLILAVNDACAPVDHSVALEKVWVRSRFGVVLVTRVIYTNPRTRRLKLFPHDGSHEAAHRATIYSYGLRQPRVGLIWDSVCDHNRRWLAKQPSKNQSGKLGDNPR